MPWQGLPYCMRWAAWHPCRECPCSASCSPSLHQAVAHRAAVRAATALGSQARHTQGSCPLMLPACMALQALLGWLSTPPSRCAHWHVLVQVGHCLVCSVIMHKKFGFVTRRRSAGGRPSCGCVAYALPFVFCCSPVAHIASTCLSCAAAAYPEGATLCVYQLRTLYLTCPCRNHFGIRCTCYFCH